MWSHGGLSQESAGTSSVRFVWVFFFLEAGGLGITAPPTEVPQGIGKRLAAPMINYSHALNLEEKQEITQRCAATSLGAVPGAQLGPKAPPEQG